MKKCLLIIIAIIFLMTGTGYGSEKIIDSQDTEIRQETFWERCETLREVVGGLAVFFLC
ncbi:MAG: hypothetical protein LBN19_04185 [Endomicrobium sp.]|jgi:hypothetical protein|nr:hypothetical protein [Endomicrobium sp.]